MFFSVFYLLQFFILQVVKQGREWVSVCEHWSKLPHPLPVPFSVAENDLQLSESGSESDSD